MMNASAGCELSVLAQLAFLTGSQMVFHLVLANKRDAVPIVRDYMIDDERALAANSFPTQQRWQKSA